jgi:arginine-tRNA-protein transferase
MKRLRLHHAPSHACSYLPDREARLAYVDPVLPMDATLYGELVALGFRRSGGLVYRPDCAACVECVPVRLPVSRFVADRSQKRVWANNRDLSVNVMPARYTPESHALYMRYLSRRHADGGAVDSSPEAFIGFLDGGWSQTAFVEFRLGSRLLAVAVVDCLPRAWSAVYTFFDPEFPTRSLGVLAVLWQIAEARRLGLDWLYLGYWVEACRKMTYKSRYRPLEAYLRGRWQAFEKGEKIPPRYANIAAFGTVSATS